jgi:hypothetical protein
MRTQRVRGFQSTAEPLRRVGKVPYNHPARQGNSTRILLIALVILLVLLVVIWAGDILVMAMPSATGSVAGMAVDERLKPVQASISVLKTGVTAQAGADGIFTLNNVPAGEQRLIVAYQGVGHEVAVVIEAGKTAEVGTIRLVTTQMPP